MPLSPLGIYNHSSVYMACKDVSPNWEDFAALLSVPRPMVERIRQDGKDSSDCLRRMLDEWLKRSSPDQPLPSWRVFMWCFVQSWFVSFWEDLFSASMWVLNLYRLEFENLSAIITVSRFWMSSYCFKLSAKYL